MFYLLAIAILLLILQSFTAVLFIKNVIVNLVLLVYLLIQELWRGAQHLYTAITTSPTAQILSSCILQSVRKATQEAFSQDFGAMATGFCKRVLLGTLKGASRVIWSIWEVEDRFMNRIFSSSNWSEADAEASFPTIMSSSNSDIFCLVPCSGYTDNGRCAKNKSMDSDGVWYCWQHERQDTRARM